MRNLRRERRSFVPWTYAAKRAWAQRQFSRWERGKLSWSALMGVLWILEHDGWDNVATELLEAIYDVKALGSQESLGTE